MLLSKVPEITVGFWVAKALSTALGESTSDYLVHRLGPYAAVFIAIAGEGDVPRRGRVS